MWRAARLIYVNPLYLRALSGKSTIRRFFVVHNITARIREMKHMPKLMPRLMQQYTAMYNIVIGGVSPVSGLLERCQVRFLITYNGFSFVGFPGWLPC